MNKIGIRSTYLDESSTAKGSILNFYVKLNSYAMFILRIEEFHLKAEKKKLLGSRDSFPDLF